MKTINNHFFKLQPLKLLLACFVKSLLDYCFVHVSSFLLPVATQLRNFASMVALQISRAGQTAYQTIQTSLVEAWSNKRLSVGVLVGLVALPAWWSHLFFSIDTRMPDFYYVNYAFYFNTIRGYLFFTFLSTGAFIAMPTKWAFRWWAVPVVIFCVSEIIKESYYTHWTDFYTALPTWQVILIVICSVPAAYFSMNYLLYRKYHLKDGTAARIIGIVKTPGIPLEQKMDILESLVKESENFNARI